MESGIELRMWIGVWIGMWDVECGMWNVGYGMSIPPHSVRIQVGVGATPGPECGAQSKQTSMHLAKI